MSLFIRFTLALFMGLILFQTAHSTTFNAANAALPAGGVQTKFNLQGYLNAYMRNSPQVKSQSNSLLNAQADYKNAFYQFLSLLHYSLASSPVPII